MRPWVFNVLTFLAIDGYAYPAILITRERRRMFENRIFPKQVMQGLTI